VAAGLRLAGIALLGIVTASLASWLIDRIRDVEEESEIATRRDIAGLTAEGRAHRDEVGLMRNREPLTFTVILDFAGSRKKECPKWLPVQVQDQLTGGLRKRQD